MASADFSIRRGDVRPILNDVLRYADGSVADLTGGATVRFVMRGQTASVPTINAAAAVGTLAGVVSYTFTGADTAVTGRYVGEWHVTFPNASTQTFPPDGYLELVVTEDLITPGGARLVGLGEVKDHLRIPTTDRTRDSRLIEMIDASTVVVENLTGPVLQRQVTESYDGGMWFITLRSRPVLEVQSVMEYRGPIGYDLTQVTNPALGTIYSYMFQAPGRIVRRTVGGGQTSFPPGADTVLITYTAGMLRVPFWVREGTLELIRENFQQTEQRSGRTTSSGMDDQAPGVVNPLSGYYVSPRVREILSPGRRHPSVA